MQNKLFNIASKPRRKNKHIEDNIQIAFCEFVKLQYKDVIFQCDLSSGMKLPIHTAARNKKMRSSRALPDFLMLEPRGWFKGFALELKKDSSEVYKKDGSLVKKIVKVKNKRGVVIEEYDHVKEQADMLEKLRGKGYYADFGMGLDDCIQKITNYMSII